MIAIDTCVVLWGIRGIEDTSGRGMRERSLQLLADCDARGEEVLIPLPAVIEAMVDVPTRQQREFFNDLKSYYRLGDLDDDAALVGAQIERIRNAASKAGTAFTASRTALKMDVLVAAVAIARGARALYTDNLDDFKKLIVYPDFDLLEIPDLP